METVRVSYGHVLELARLYLKQPRILQIHWQMCTTDGLSVHPNGESVRLANCGPKVVGTLLLLIVMAILQLTFSLCMMSAKVKLKNNNHSKSFVICPVLFYITIFSYTTDKRGKIHWAKLSQFQPLKVFVGILSQCLGQKCLLFSIIKERCLYSDTYLIMSYMHLSSCICGFHK